MHASIPRPVALGLAAALVLGAGIGSLPVSAADRALDPAGVASAQTPPPPPPPPGQPGGSGGQNPNPGTAPPPPSPGQPGGQPQPPPQASFTGSGNVTLSLDTPAANAVVTTKDLHVKGWAVDPSAGEGTGVTEVRVYIDGSRESGSLLGTAEYGVARQDVARALGEGDRYLFSGFDLVWTEVLRAAPGVHTITVAAYSPTSGWAERTVPVTIEGRLAVTAHAYIADAYSYGGGYAPYPPIYGRPPVSGTGGVKPPPPPGSGSYYPPAALPAFVPVTFTAVVTRNGAPVAGATVFVNNVGHMPPTDPNGYTQLTVTLPVSGPQALLGAHLTVTYEGQTADTDAYVRYTY